MTDLSFAKNVEFFFKACAEGDLAQVKQCIEKTHSLTEVYLGLAFATAKRHEDVFDFLSEYALKNEAPSPPFQGGNCSYSINAMVEVLVQRNWAEKIDQVLLSHPSNLLDTALDWTLEEFAENETFGDPNPNAFSDKTKGVTHIIAKILDQPKRFPQAFKNVIHLATEQWLHPLFDYMIDISDNATQQKIADLFLLKDAPHKVKSIKEKKMLERSLKRKATLKRISSPFSSQEEKTQGNSSHPAPKKKM